MSECFVLYNRDSWMDEYTYIQDVEAILQSKMVRSSKRLKLTLG